MRYLDATQRDLDLSSFQRRSASNSDCSTFVDFDCTVLVGGQPKVVYLSKVSHPLVTKTRESVARVKYPGNTRTGGLVTLSRIFGYAPRNVLRNAPCRATTMAVEHPEEHASICSAASVVDAYYARHFPDVHKKHKALTTKVRDQWMIPGSVFTSGIANCNNPLQYHFDTGNFSGVCSAMLGFRHKASGGHLSCPEIDVAFEIGDCSLILFDGQKLLHGVTPITRHAPDAFRYTVVYYSLKQMWNCDTVQGEVDRLRTKRSEIERSPRKQQARRKA